MSDTPRTDAEAIRFTESFVPALPIYGVGLNFSRAMERELAEAKEHGALAHLRAERLSDALRLLVNDVQDYESWQRPCHALDVARRALGITTEAA